MKRFDRRALFASGAAAALLAASGVSALPQRGGRFSAALSGASRSDTWDRSTGLFSQAAHATLFEGLTEIAADGTLRGEIATGWQSDDACRHWTFDLRETVFHDGRSLALEDVAYSLADLGAVSLSRGTLALALTAPDPNLPFRLAGPDYLVRPGDAMRRAAGIGSGLYRLRKFDAGRQFIADRVDVHWRDGQAGWFDSVEFVGFEDAAVRAQALAEGLVDAADVTEMDARMDQSAYTRLPDAARVMQIVSTAISVPMQVGRVYALDNLRMAERWWRA